MRVPLDECLPRKLRFEFPNLNVSTVSAQGWSSTTNGQLLRQATRQFDVLITADQRPRYQQDLSRFEIAVIVLKARTNKMSDLQPLIPACRQALTSIQLGQVVEIPSDWQWSRWVAKPPVRARHFFSACLQPVRSTDDSSFRR